MLKQSLRAFNSMIGSIWSFKIKWAKSLSTRSFKIKDRNMSSPLTTLRDSKHLWKTLLRRKCKSLIKKKKIAGESQLKRRRKTNWESYPTGFITSSQAFLGKMKSRKGQKIYINLVSICRYSALPSWLSKTIT